MGSRPVDFHFFQKIFFKPHAIASIPDKGPVRSTGRQHPGRFRWRNGILGSLPSKNTREETAKTLAMHLPAGGISSVSLIKTGCINH